MKDDKLSQILNEIQILTAAESLKLAKIKKPTNPDLLTKIEDWHGSAFLFCRTVERLRVPIYNVYSNQLQEERREMMNLLSKQFQGCMSSIEPENIDDI